LRIAAVEERRRQVHTSAVPMLSGVTSMIELVAPGGGPTSAACNETRLKRTIRA
jgi:hypothetical protein